MYLTEQNQKLHVPERIFLHLVENKDGEDPFVFMATYASLGEDHAVHHMPLKYALTEYQDDRDKLLALLSCLNRAAEVSDLIAELVESGEMFHVLRFTGKEAYQFLRDVEKNRTDRDSLPDSELVEKACNGVFGRNTAGRKETCHGRI